MWELQEPTLGFEKSYALISDSQIHRKLEAAVCEVTTFLSDVSKLGCAFGFAGTHSIFFEGRGQEANVFIVLTYHSVKQLYLSDAEEPKALYMLG